MEILVCLMQSPEANLRARALETWRRWELREVLRVMSNPATAPGVLQFAAQQVLEGREELKQALVENPRLAPELRDLLETKGYLKSGATEWDEEPAAVEQPEPLLRPSGEAVNDSAQEPDLKTIGATDVDQAGVELLAKLAAGVHIEGVDTPPEATKRDDELTKEERQTLIQKVGRMTVVEKIKAALTGNLETRSLLIRETNRIVTRAVLQSPKVTETEAESYASAKNVSEEVLRLIALNRRFMKNYAVFRALINNPRAPIDITLPLVIRLNPKDLKGLALNRNVPDVLRSMASKLIKQREDASRPKDLSRS